MKASSLKFTTKTRSPEFPALTSSISACMASGRLWRMEPELIHQEPDASRTFRVADRCYLLALVVLKEDKVFGLQAGNRMMLAVACRHSYRHCPRVQLIPSLLLSACSRKHASC